MEEITDYEIRYIGKPRLNDSAAGQPSPKAPPPDHDDPKKKRRWYAIFIVITLILAVIAFIFSTSYLSPPNEQYTQNEEPVLADPVDNAEEMGQFEAQEMTSDNPSIETILKVSGTKTVSDCQEDSTIINDIPIRILTVQNAVPEFHVGKINRNDTTIVLALQAADIRKDNGKIVGAAVLDGEVVSKGLSKKGFVAIINGDFTIGVSESSPLFERAIETGGDFFRQYPLVDNGRLVENVVKGLSIRRAICEHSDGQTFVVESRIPVSFHDFSQALIDMKVRNAVYLVGSQYACGFKREADGKLETWGNEKFSRAKYVSYLLWRKTK